MTLEPNSPSSLPEPIHPKVWIEAYDEDEDSRHIRQEVETNPESEFQLVNDLLYYRMKLFVPRSLRRKMIQENHDLGVAAHDGIDNTLYRLRHFYWPAIRHDVTAYVSQCRRCQLRKPKRQAPHGTMQPHNATFPLEIVAFDHIGPWHATISNKRFICVGIDTFSKYVFAKAVEDQSAATFTECLSEFVGWFGIPHTLLTDNSKAFDNSVVRALEDELGIRHRFSAPPSFPG